MQAEFQFLLTYTNPTSAAGKIIPYSLDWDNLLLMSLRQGVMPFLHCQSDLCKESFAAPSQFLADLRLAFHKNMVTSLCVATDLFNLVEQLKIRNLQALPFKGPVVSFMAYGDVALRQSGDIDLLIKRKDLPAAEKVLGDCGYQRQTKYTLAQERRFLQVDCQHVFYNQEKDIALDLHWEFVPDYWGIRLNTEELWARARPALIEDTWVEVFAPEDTLLILVLNAAKDLFNRLIRLYDIAGFIQRHPALDWPGLIARAQTNGMGRMLKVSLYLVYDLLETPLPADVANYVKDDKVIKGLARQAQNWLCEQVPTTDESVTNLTKPACLMDSPGARLRFYRRLALTPTLQDWAVAELPKPLEFGYYLIRAARLARKYLLR